MKIKGRKQKYNPQSDMPMFSSSDITCFENQTNRLCVYHALQYRNANTQCDLRTTAKITATSGNNSIIDLK
jgi:hypothetical protein